MPHAAVYPRHIGWDGGGKKIGYLIPNHRWEFMRLCLQLVAVVLWFPISKISEYLFRNPIVQLLPLIQCQYSISAWRLQYRRKYVYRGWQSDRPRDNLYGFFPADSSWCLLSLSILLKRYLLLDSVKAPWTRKFSVFQKTRASDLLSNFQTWDKPCGMNNTKGWGVGSRGMTL